LRERGGVRGIRIESLGILQLDHPTFTLPEAVKKFHSALFHVIPAKAGIQCFQSLNKGLGPGFHRGEALI
jgi:hypothetical protein